MMGKYTGALEMIRRANAKQLRAKGLEPTQLWFHGTSRDIEPTSERPLWLGSPDLALQFTGGTRMGGVTRRGGLGRMYPFLLREEPHNTKLTVTGDVDLHDSNWMEKNFGIKDAFKFRDEVARRAEEQIMREYEENPYYKSLDHIAPTWDDMGFTGLVNKNLAQEGFNRRARARLYEVLDNKPFLQQLRAEFGEPSSFKFDHPNQKTRITPGGIRKTHPQIYHEPAILVPNPEEGLVNFFEALRME